MYPADRSRWRVGLRCASDSGRAGVLFPPKNQPVKRDNALAALRRAERHKLKIFSPRPMPETPERTTSRMVAPSKARMQASSFSDVPAS